METPSLIDISFRNHLYEKLRTCHDYKLNIYSYIVNLAFFLGFVLLMTIIFFLAKKPKLTPEEEAYLTGCIPKETSQPFSSSKSPSSLTTCCA